jgi:sec-independent protein translocase protein TatC
MEDVKQPLTAHLEELRSRLIKSLGAVAVGFLVSYQFVEPLMSWLIAPVRVLESSKVQIIGTGLAEAFFTKLKVAAIAGLFLGSPVLFHQSWKFVAPGLYDQEKKYVRPFVFFATIFFVSGAYFCYRLVFPTAFGFFLSEYESVEIAPLLKISEYLSFASRMLLAFGVVFELPVITFFLARVGLVTHKTMIGFWRYAIIAIFVIAGVLTPGPDVASQLLMAAPLIVLYIVSIGVAWMFAKPPAPAVD